MGGFEDRIVRGGEIGLERLHAQIAFAQNRIELHARGDEQPSLVAGCLGAALIGFAERLAVGSLPRMTDDDRNACHSCFPKLHPSGVISAVEEAAL